MNPNRYLTKGKKERSSMRRLSRVMTLSAVLVAAFSNAQAMEYKEFSDEFRKNTEAFKHKYNGKTVTVTGTVGLISLEPSRSGPGSGPTIVMMDLDKETLRCYLNDADKERAISLAIGDRVTITGTFLQANVAGLHVDPCTFR
jgi:hypothetical protein